IGPGCSPRDCVGFEGDFVPHMPEPKAEFQRGASGASAFRSASPSVSQNCLRSPGRPQERLKAEQGQERKAYVTSVSYCTYIITMLSPGNLQTCVRPAIFGRTALNLISHFCAGPRSKNREGNPSQKMRRTS